MLRTILNCENCRKEGKKVSGEVERARVATTNDKDTVTGSLELRQHAVEEDELRRRIGEVDKGLLGRCSTRLDVGRNEVRVTERLAKLHQDVAGEER